MLTLDQFKQLRSEVVLNSLYLSDYENSLGINPLMVYDFFEGYLDEKMDIYCESHPRATPKTKDRYFYKVLDENDINDMYNYYLSIEGDMLPISED